MDNAALATKVAPIVEPPVEFFTVDIGGGMKLDGWMLKPADFDPTRKYPVIVYVYGEPAGRRCDDGGAASAGCSIACWPTQGYIVVSVDNRGTPAPKGAAWRKVVYGTVGDLSVEGAGGGDPRVADAARRTSTRRGRRSGDGAAAARRR